ncbi:hypothetical protein OS965_12500 [Streptomyces sp. H27-G5]|uniref:hypothetical protein n=1 Tax=Streptomyces sp. H27-G5 TaxID=2996698 RepID=UPI00226EF740|nr:hypothetical protein [Streptomyces sp. H27-G5]MCY0918992.1 hypothetical protein [Streptomyces sp. H27-G5]
MPDSNDPLRSMFQEAVSAGQQGTALAPVSVIARRGERARRRRITGLAVAACLVVAGSGAAMAGLLPEGGSGNLPATTPSPLRSPSPSSAPPPSSTPTSPPSSSATTFPLSSPPPTARTTEPALPNATVPPPTGGPTGEPSSTATR